MIHELFDKYVDNIYEFDCGIQGGDWNFDELLNNNIVDDLVSGANYPCYNIFNRFHITVQGYLDICCVDINNNLAIADLKKMSLKDAWNSDLFVNIRRKHLEGVEAQKGTMCYNCLSVQNNVITPVNP